MKKRIAMKIVKAMCDNINHNVPQRHSAYQIEIASTIHHRLFRKFAKRIILGRRVVMNVFEFARWDNDE